MRPTAGLHQDPLSRGVGGSVLHVVLLGDGSFQSPSLAVHGPALPFAYVAVQDVLDVLNDEVNGHWRETDRGDFQASLEMLEKSAGKVVFKKKHSPMLSTPLGMMTSAYFLV